MLRPSPYAFFTRWHLTAPIDRVARVIEDPTCWPTFWPAVAEARRLSPARRDGLGERVRVTWRAPFGYRLSFDSETAHRVPPRQYDFRAIGDLFGRGRFMLRPTDAGTEVDYHWHVLTRPLWMRALAPVARPAFTWNHDQIMSEGGRGLADHLGVRLLDQHHLAGEAARQRWPDATEPLADENLPRRIAEVVAASAGPPPEGDRALQRWEDLCFLHWRIDPAFLTPLLHRGLQPQLVDGDAWVSLVALRTTQLAAPRRGDWARRPFAQVNLRTYVHDGERAGVQFLGVQCGHRLMAGAVRRMAHLPYVPARVTHTPHGGGWHTRVRGPLGRLSLRWHWDGAPDACHDPLAEQYASFTEHHGLLRGDVAHAPWTLGPASVRIIENTMLRHAGLGHLHPTAPDRVAASPCIDAVTSGPVPA